MKITPKSTDTELSYAFKISFPTLIAYIPLGAVFAVLFAHSGFDWYLAPLMSLMAFAGSVQFVALSMMTEHAHISTIVLATIFIAFRNSFYGLALLNRFSHKGWRKWFLIFTLVDSTYVLLITHPPRPEFNDHKFCLLLSALIYSYWVGGAVIGAFFSNYLPPFSGLAFILPCFFMVLVIEYYIAKRKWHTLVVPIIASVIAYYAMPKQYLLVAIILSMLAILAINHFWERHHAPKP